MRVAIVAQQMHCQCLGQATDVQRAGLGPVEQFATQLIHQPAHRLVPCTGNVQQGNAGALRPQQFTRRLVDERQAEIQVHHLEARALQRLPAHLIGLVRVGQEEVARTDVHRAPLAARCALLDLRSTGQHQDQQRLHHRRHADRYFDRTVAEQLQHDVLGRHWQLGQLRFGGQVTAHGLGRGTAGSRQGRGVGWPRHVKLQDKTASGWVVSVAQRRPVPRIEHGANRRADFSPPLCGPAVRRCLDPAFARKSPTARASQRKFGAQR